MENDGLPYFSGAPRQRTAGQKEAGRLGRGAFFGVVPELWRFPVSNPVSPQPPVRHSVSLSLAFPRLEISIVP